MSIASLHITPTRMQRWLGCRSTPLVRTSAILITIIVIAGCAFAVQRGVESFTQLRDVRATIERLNDDLTQLQTALNKPAQVLPKEQATEFNRVTRHLNTPWADIFALLERRIPANVALISIEPDANRRMVRLQAEARTLDDLMRCAQALRSDVDVLRVMPLEHETNEQDPSRPVRLTLELVMKWSA